MARQIHTQAPQVFTFYSKEREREREREKRKNNVDGKEAGRETERVRTPVCMVCCVQYVVWRRGNPWAQT